MAHTGTRIRDRRLAMGLSQTDFAARLGISGSYLNLIEHNRRRIGPKLLDDIARVLMVDAGMLDSGAGPEVIARLEEAGQRAGFSDPDLAQAADLATRFPRWADLLVGQAAVVAGQADDGTDALQDVVSAIASTAQALVDMPDLPVDWQDRFARRIAGDSLRLHSLLLRAKPRGEAPDVWQTANAALNSDSWHRAFLAGESAAFAGLTDEAHGLASRYVAELGRDISPDQRRQIVASDDRLRGLAQPQALQIHAELSAHFGLLHVDARGRVMRFKASEGMEDAPDCLLWPIYAEELSLGRPLQRIVAASGIFYHVTAMVMPRADEMSPRDRVMVWRKTDTEQADAVACSHGVCRH